MSDALQIVLYPDPRLKKVSQPVTEFDDDLRDTVARMFDLMREERGVGLAAPQVGINKRFFVMNATGEPGDDRVYVNPELSEPEGEEEDEEGCLSLPDLRTPVLRSLRLRMRAKDVHGNEIDEVREGFWARVWQHETDHLDGVLITDRMSPTRKIAARRILKDLEAEYRATHPPAEKPKPRFLGRGPKRRK